MMKKISVMLLCAIILILPITTRATDLPIDITAIGRQDIRTTHVTTRVGANLFTSDSQRINEILAERILQRQAMTTYLFETISYNYEIDPHARIMYAASDLALFAQPNFNTFSSPQAEEEIPLWILAVIIAVCAIGGFIWALVSGAKKRRKAESVY